MKKTIALTLILIAVALGFLHGASRFKAERDRGRPDLEAGRGGGPEKGTGATEAAPPKPAAEPAAAPAPAPPPPPPPPVDTVELDLAAARSALSEGDLGLEKGDYASARTAYEAARKRLEGLKSIAALPLVQLAERGEARAEVLGALAATVEPNDFASGEGLTKLTLKGEDGKAGREYVARVLSVSGGSISFRLASGVELALPTTELAGPVEPCTRDEWRARVLKGFAERKDKTDEENAFQLFRLFAYAVENGLKEEAIPALERAFEKDKGGRLVEYFCEGAKRPSAAAVTLARARGEAEVASAAAPAASESSSGAPGGGTAPPLAAGDVRLDPRFKAALARLEEGIEHYRKSFRGNVAAEAELKRALTIFNEVAAALDKLREQLPASGILDEKIVEVNQMRVDCHKRAAIGGS